MAKKNQLTKSDYLPMDELKKLLNKLHQNKNTSGSFMCAYHFVQHSEPQMYCH